MSPARPRSTTGATATCASPSAGGRRFGPTQLELEEARELPDSRLFALIKQLATGPRSGAEVELHYVTIHSCEGDKMSRGEVFADQRKGRAAAGLEP
jgi:hypothetical protein